MSVRNLAAVLFTASLCLAPATSAQAQLFRAYLASTGSDSGNCSITAPCRLLPAALAAVASGGEIWMLDSANYNGSTVNVTKPVKILAVPGAIGSIVSTGGTPAMVVNAPSGVVTLRNLVVVPFPGQTTSDAIAFQAESGELVVEDCSITGTFNNGIAVAGPKFARLLVRNTTIRGSLTSIRIDALQAASVIRVSIASSNLLDALFALVANSGTELTVTGTTIAGTGSNALGTGISLFSNGTSGPVAAHVTNSTVHSFENGVSVSQIAPFVSTSIASSEIAHTNVALTASGGATIAISGTRVVHNHIVAQAISGSVIFTSGTNYNAYNNAAGSALSGPGGAL